MFAAPAKAEVVEPLTITQLMNLSKENLSLTKYINYENVAVPDMFGLKNNNDSFTSFNEAVNLENFGDLQKTGPIDRNSKRVGVLAYKIGCTHFFDRWGRVLPCTVL